MPSLDDDEEFAVFPPRVCKMNHKLKVWFKNVGALLLSLLFVIIFLEMVIRIGFPDAAQIVTVGYKGDGLNSELATMDVSDDPILLYDWKEKFHAANKIKKETSGKVRIIILGDSVTRIAIEDWKYYPFILEGLLNSKAGFDKYEVINAGVPGYDTVQEARYLKVKFLPRVSPRLVIVGYCAQTDRVIKRKLVRYKDGLYSSDSMESQPYFFDLPFGLNTFLIKHSSLYKFINSALFRTGEKFKLDFITERVQYYDLSYKTEEAIKELASLSHQKNFDLLVVVFPRLNEEPSCNFESNWIVAKCKESNINYIDLRDVYKNIGYDKLRMKPDDTCHPNSLGHNLAAEAIFSYLKAKIKL